MKCSLIPEKPILVYPSLAATIGLEEATLLAALSELSLRAVVNHTQGRSWFRLAVGMLQEALPFWDTRDLQRVLTSLREKGVLLIASAPLNESSELKFCFNESEKNEPTRRTLATPSSPRGKNFISPNWRPDDTTLTQLAQLGVPQNFSFEQLPEFVSYWRERNETQHAWGTKFLSHVLQRWRKFEAQQARQERATPISSTWQPSSSTLAHLEERGLSRDFIFDQVNEFVKFWQATNEAHLSWESKFIQRVTDRWADLQAKRNVAQADYPMFKGWRPSTDAREVMEQQSGIPRSFIDDAIPEFIIYWQDRGTESSTWNSLFIKHVRLQWHRYQHALQHAAEASPIPHDWQPSNDVFDILTLANIDAAFARALVPEFVLYWQERNELHRSWNSKFLYHVKRSWAARHAIGQQTDTGRSTRDLSLEEELNDTSWANG